MTEDREKFVSHSEMIRNALWSSQVVRHGVDVIPAHGASVLVGAGMSRNAVVDHTRGFELPDWSAISRNLVEPLAPEDEDLQADLLNSTGAVSGFLRLAQMYEARFGRAQLDRFIENSIKDDLLAPGRTHELLVHIPWRDIFTTNWDTLLETTARNDRLRRYGVVNKIEDLPKTPGRRIVKLHGTVHQSKKYIFTEEDFRTYPTDFAPFVNTVQQSMMETVFVLVGFSGEDPNFLKWTGWVRDRLGDYAPTLYLVGDHSRGLPAREMLQLNKVVPLDLSLITDDELRQSGVRKITRASRWNHWFRYLLDGEQLPLTIWPQTKGRRGRRTGPIFGPSGMKLQEEPVPSEDQGSESKGVKLFTPGLGDLTVDKALFQQLRQDMTDLRATHRKWIVTPPDARDEVLQHISNWHALKTRLPSFLNDDVTFIGFMNSCAKALKSDEAFGKQVLVELGLNETLEKETQEALQTWASTDMERDVALFFIDVAWLSCLVLDDIPTPVNEALIDLVMKDIGSKDVPAFTNSALPVLDTSEGRLIRERLIQSLLQQNRYQGMPAELYKHLLSYAENLAKQGVDSAPFNFEVLLHRVFWYAGMGDRYAAMKQVRKRVDLNTNALRPYDLARLASVYSEFGVNKADLDVASKLRHEAFSKTRGLGQSAHVDFELLSEESWLLAFEAESNHTYINQLNPDEAAISDMWRKGAQARLDELTACRCDPRRDLRRIERGYRDERYRRQGVKVLNRVGFPLDEQTLNRSDPSIITSNLLLGSFAWKAALATLEGAKAKLLSPSHTLRLPLWKELDADVVEALHLVFRVLSHPERNWVYGSSASDGLNLDKQFLPDLIEIGRRLMNAEQSSDTVDPCSVHLCCDALRRALKNLTNDRPQSARNTIRLSLIALDCLCRSLGTGSRRGDEAEEPRWSKTLSEKAVKVLVELAFTKSAIPNGDLPNSMRGSWDNSVERLLRLALSKALHYPELVPWVFNLLWEKTKSVADAGERRQIEPFHLIGSPPDLVVDADGPPRSPVEYEDENGNLKDALKYLEKLEANAQDCEDRKSDLIRFIDVMSDWNFSMSEQQRASFAEIVTKVFGRCEPGRGAGLRRWEWMMIDAVREPATLAFEKWAFSPGLKVVPTDTTWRDEARQVSKNLYGAICQPRTGYHPKLAHVRSILKWMNAVIDAYRNTGQLSELRETARFTAIFLRLVEGDGIIGRLKTRDFELVLDTLSNLLSVGAQVEMAVPKVAQKFSVGNGDSPQFRRLSSLLRRGLAMIHHPERQDQFDRAIKATLDWLILVGNNEDVAPPQPALLGALGQALALPRSDRGRRVLMAISQLLASGHGNDTAVVVDVVADLRQRVDGMLTGVAHVPDQSEGIDGNKGHEETVNAIRDTFLSLRDFAQQAGMTEDTIRLAQGIRALGADLDSPQE